MTSALTSTRVWALFRPLALSWLFMAVEGPVAIGVLGRLPQPAINMAGLLILFAVAMWIESPIIDLLSTSTAFAKGRNSWASVQRYAWYMGIWAVGIHALVALTPLYGLIVKGLLRVPEPVSDAVHPAFVLMIPWSGLIGWRRARQGLLIASGETRLIGRGTSIRMVAMILGSCLFGFGFHLPGVQAAAAGLMLSVASEALFVHLASHHAVRTINAVEDEPVTMSRVAHFHLPLALTTMVNLVATPIIAAGLSHTIAPVSSLAAYEVMSSVLFIHRAAMFALPELIISTYKQEEDRVILGRFATQVGLVASGSVLLLGGTGLTERFFAGPMGASLEVARAANIMFLTCALIPILEAGHSYLGGVLATKHRTGPRVWAVVAGVGAMVAIIGLAVTARWPGWAMGSVAKSAGIAAEAAILAFAWFRISRARTSPSPA